MDEILVRITPDGTVELDVQGLFQETDPCELTRLLQDALGGGVLVDRKKPELLRPRTHREEVQRVRR